MMRYLDRYAGIYRDGFGFAWIWQNTIQRTWYRLLRFLDQHGHMITPDGCIRSIRDFRWRKVKPPVHEMTPEEWKSEKKRLGIKV